VDEAKREARRMLDALGAHVAAGATIVGLEPSCLLTLRDEFLVMGLGEDATAVAARALLIEEFLAHDHRAGRLDLPLGPLPHKRALLHGHCHQKAFDALDPVAALLQRIPGLTVDVVESSCCGMAGTFGYEASHYDVSMRMAELALLPAIRDAGPDALIVADGTSCRHQIAHGTGESRRAVHAIRVLAQSVEQHRLLAEQASAGALAQSR
jgi:Fe-S oxidoreductase